MPLQPLFDACPLCTFHTAADKELNRPAATHHALSRQQKITKIAQLPLLLRTSCINHNYSLGMRP